MHASSRFALPAIATIVALAMVCRSAIADLPSIRFDRLTPLGAAAGSSIEVEIAGADIEDVKALMFDHSGLRAEHLKERRFRISIGSDVPAGTYDVRLVGRFGVSNPRLFAVSQGLTEVAAKEPNHDIATAQPISVNTVVNGTSQGNREDVYRFQAKSAQRVVIECQAGKLDSLMHATLTLMSGDGKQIASNNDYNGPDPLIDFVAPRDGDYYVSVHDLSFRGGQPYRLTVSDHPQVENIFPRAVQMGRAATVTVFGRNLGAGAKPSSWRIQDLPLEEMPLTIAPPADVFALGAYRFFEHPTDHSALPTAATCTLTGFQVQPHAGQFVANAVPVLLVDTPVTLEQEPNDDPGKAQRIELPAVVSGRFDRPRDADWYEFETTADGPYAFDVYSERIAGRADPYLVVVDDKGNRVVELDDYGHRMNAFDGHLRDPSGMVNLAGKRKYRVLVQDRYGRGGARFQYVLTVHKPEPDFYAAVIHHQNPGPGGTTVRRGGATSLDVVIHHRDGFNGPITLTAEGLPPGVHTAPTTISDTRGTMVFWADANAPDWSGTVKLFATGKRGDVTLRREVRPYTRVWTDPSLSSSRPTRELALAVRESAPFSLGFVAERIEVEAGKRAELKLHLDRQWPDFKKDVTVLPLSFPGNFKMANALIPAATSDVAVTIDVQPNTRPGEYTLAVLGQAQVPYNKDAKATQKPNTLVSQPSRPVTVVVLPKSTSKADALSIFLSIQGPSVVILRVEN
jgi:hypothetical protein